MKPRKKERYWYQPELELGEAANERTELIGGSGGKGGSAVVNVGIHLRGEESDEEAKKVNGKTVGYDVETFHHVHAENVDQPNPQACHPPPRNMRCRFVKKVLILPRHREFKSGYGGFRG